MSTTLQTEQPTFFIKIKYNGALRKVQVPSHPPPNWSKLANAIVSRFGIPADQPIGLQYRDSDLDLVTISSQVELDELWDEIKLSSQSKTKPSSIQQLIHFILVLINSLEVTSKSESQSDAKDPIPSPLAETGQPDQRELNKPSRIPDDEVPDPPEVPINDSETTSSIITSKINKLCTALEQADLMTPQLQSTVGSYAQMMAQFTGLINTACSTVADHFQASQTQGSDLTCQPAALDNPLEDTTLNSKNHTARESSPHALPTRAKTFQPSSQRPAPSVSKEPICKRTPVPPPAPSASQELACEQSPIKSWICGAERDQSPVGPSTTVDALRKRNVVNSVFGDQGGLTPVEYLLDMRQTRADKAIFHHPLERTPVASISRSSREEIEVASTLRDLLRRASAESPPISRTRSPLLGLAREQTPVRTPISSVVGSPVFAREQTPVRTPTWSVVESPIFAREPTPASSPIFRAPREQTSGGLPIWRIPSPITREQTLVTSSRLRFASSDPEAVHEETDILSPVLRIASSYQEAVHEETGLPCPVLRSPSLLEEPFQNCRQSGWVSRGLPPPNRVVPTPWMDVVTQPTGSVTSVPQGQGSRRKIKQRKR